MPEFVLPPPAPAAIPVAGGGAFPVRRVFCVGRNYAAHAREMGSDPDREPPFFFMKPADALVTDGADTPYPPATADLHHEMELVVGLAEGGVDIAEADALKPMSGAMPPGSTSPAATCRARRRRKASPGTWARGSTIPARSASWCRPRVSAIRRADASFST